VHHARRSGIARKLVVEAERWALAAGCTELASDAPIENISSHAMHAALGFVETERVVFFKKVLRAMELRPASIDDCREIAEVHVAAWKAAYADLLPPDYLAGLSVAAREAMWQQVLTVGRSEVILALEEGAVVGFACFGPSRDADATPERGEISALYVAPSSWSRGVGKNLVQSARERLRGLGFDSVSLWVLAGKERAIRFYSAAGFSPELGTERTVNLGGTKLQELRMVAALAG
jgi:GNAT superfamily N-acetyltransferase